MENKKEGEEREKGKGNEVVERMKRGRKGGEVGKMKRKGSDMTRGSREGEGGK